jgi:hypothetical protein
LENSEQLALHSQRPAISYPVLEHVKRLVDDKIIWAPEINCDGCPESAGLEVFRVGQIGVCEYGLTKFRSLQNSAPQVGALQTEETQVEKATVSNSACDDPRVNIDSLTGVR